MPLVASIALYCQLVLVGLLPPPHLAAPRAGPPAPPGGRGGGAADVAVAPGGGGHEGRGLEDALDARRRAVARHAVDALEDSHIGGRGLAATATTGRGVSRRPLRGGGSSRANVFLGVLTLTAVARFAAAGRTWLVRGARGVLGAEGLRDT